MRNNEENNKFINMPSFDILLINHYLYVIKVSLVLISQSIK